MFVIAGMVRRRWNQALVVELPVEVRHSRDGRIVSEILKQLQRLSTMLHTCLIDHR